jgi:hypothetical protein
MTELGPSILNVDFVIDVKTVAEHVQPMTDKFLRQL